MPHNDSFMIHCEGWWEQRPFGREPMENLRLSLHDGRLEGAGTDVVGPFTFAGTITKDGAVAMQKQYLGKHSVDYFGTYDGEGVLSGQWTIPGDRGAWMIRLRRLELDDDAEIKEILPKR